MSQNNTSLKYLVSISKGKKPRFEIDEFQEGLLPYLSMDYLRGKNAASFYCDEATDSIVKVEDNDLLILWDGSNAGEIVYGKVGALSSTMAKIDIISEKVHKEFLTYFLIHSQPHLKANTVGMGIPHVNGDELRNLVVYLPSLIEQSQIAAFLDRKTAQIDTIIEKKQKLLLLLDEKKKAVINEAVTGQKVWDGNAWVKPAEVKDSGVEWIGKIPRAWNTALLKYVCEFILDGTHGSHARVDEGYRLLSVRNIVDNKFVFRNDDSFIDKENYDQITSRFKNIEGDIILAIVGATLGKGAFVEKMNEEFATQRSVATIRVKPEFNKKYFYYFIISDSYYNFLWSNTSFSAQPGIYLNTLSGSQCLIPTLKEQDEIVRMVENKIERINLAKDKIIVQINKLQEYRQSLISEAVTGKIDLSNFN